MKTRCLRPQDGRGFTLLELLVVIVIIALISAVALPVVLPALDERRVSEAARELQGALAGARDQAIRANAPRGIRLLPDPILSPFPFGNSRNGILTSNRYVPIEPGPDYSEGLVTAVFNTSNAILNSPPFLQIVQAPTSTIFITSTTSVNLPNEPTGWYFNIRQGDKIRFNDSGAYYTIAGPMTVGPAFLDNTGQPLANGQQNSERFINFGLGYTGVEYLNLVNGVDDDGDGWVDEGFDGIDNDGDGIVDPGFNGIDDNKDGHVDEPAELYIGLTYGAEFEQEVFVGDPPSSLNPSAYTIVRRPVVSPGTREVTLPDGIVIDFTTYNAAAAIKITAANASNSNVLVQLPERSRAPVDPYNYSVDILVSPSGQIVQAGAGSAGIDQNNSSPTSNLPFYHFWLTERKGVVAPLWGTSVNPPYIPSLNPNSPTQTYLLPMPQGSTNLIASGGNAPGTVVYSGTPLLGERRLVTMFTRSGQVVTNSIEIFDPVDINRPFYDAQAGNKESK
jgi:prepilin-type N-terminal cleavage/methylation domain-containing protein